MSWPPSIKTLAAVSLLIVLGLVVFRFLSVPAPRPGIRIDAQRNPLLVFVVIDTLRRDHVGAFGYGRATTPALDRLASEGFVASGMIAHSSQTVPSVASMLTSKAPHAHGVQYDPRTGGFGNDGESEGPFLVDDNLTLAEVLSNEGYFTAAAVDNPWLRREFGFAQGFDEYIESLCLKFGDRVCDGARINKAASRVIHEHASEKTFLYLHYMDVHNPYAHAGKLPRVFRKGSGRVVYTRGLIRGVSAENLAYSIGAYDDGVLYTDSLIGELARELEAAAAERDHERLSGTMDIAPTLLDLVGIPKPAEMAGRSLLESASGGAVIAELAAKKAAIDEHWGLVRDLDTNEDEVVAYAGASESAPTPDQIAELEALLDSLEMRETPLKSLSTDPTVVQQLKALGYVE
jgi:hypothetical protein